MPAPEHHSPWRHRLGRELRSAVALAFIPLGVGLTFGALLLPRRAEPEIVPVPLPRAGELARARAVDRGLAAQARATPLPAAVRALGTAVRSFHALEADDADGRSLGDARKGVDEALIESLRLEDPERALLELRAVQLEGFLAEVHRFESTGQETPELRALAGAFVRTMTAEGWCDGHALAASEDALRAMYKEMWNAFLGFDKRPAFAPTLDEERALYAFFIAHAHPAKSMRQALDAARRGARDAKACLALAEAERNATEAWRLERIARIGLLDPEYPTDFARGVASYRRGDFTAAAQAFRDWLREHPSGPYALRAENHLRAAVDAARVE